MVAQSESKARIIGYKFDAYHLHWHASIDYPQNEHYFARYGTGVEPAADQLAFEKFVRQRAVAEPSLWVMYREFLVDTAEASELEAIMEAANYAACDVQELGVDTVLTLYTWGTLACQPAQLLATSDSELLTYEFYGSIVERDENRLLFVDRWQARADFPHDNFALSIQLLSEDWSNEAQVDLPLAHEGELRQFSIDLSKVPTGNYRMMAILYDKHTGEKSSWLAKPGPVPSLLTLAEIELTK